jgi:hypothetical protein
MVVATLALGVEDIRRLSGCGDRLWCPLSSQRNHHFNHLNIIAGCSIKATYFQVNAASHLGVWSTLV